MKTAQQTVMKTGQGDDFSSSDWSLSWVIFRFVLGVIACMTGRFIELSDRLRQLDSYVKATTFSIISRFFGLIYCLIWLGNHIILADFWNQDRFSDQREYLLDSCSSLNRANQLGWVKFAKSRSGPRVGVELEWFEIVPQRLAIFVSLKRQIEDSQSADPDQMRTILMDKLTSNKVGTLVRLRERQLEDKELENHGIACVSCEYDTEIPPPSAITSFLFTLRSCAKKGSMVAVDGDLQRSGMLCALHLMEAHGFDTGAACAWLRLKCPGMELGLGEVGYLRFVGSQAVCPGIPREAAIHRAVFRAWHDGLAGEGMRARPESSYHPSDRIPMMECGGSAEAKGEERWDESLMQPATLWDGGGDDEDVSLRKGSAATEPRRFDSGWPPASPLSLRISVQAGEAELRSVEE